MRVEEALELTIVCVRYLRRAHAVNREAGRDWRGLHIEVERHLYTVPHRLIHRTVDVRQG